MPVYLIRAGEHGPVKIGKADNPWQRRSELQVAHWEELRLLRIWEGSEAEEAQLHRRFLDHRLRGDWFTFSRAMLRDVGLREIPLPDAPGTVGLILPAIERGDFGRGAQQALIAEIEAFLAVDGMAETTFGRVVVNDGKFVPRLRSGANMTLATIERVRAFLRERAPVPQAA